MLAAAAVALGCVPIPPDVAATFAEPRPGEPNHYEPGRGRSAARATATPPAAEARPAGSPAAQPAKAAPSSTPAGASPAPAAEVQP